MAKPITNPDVVDGLDAEQNPDTSKWRWLWTSPNGAACIGLFTHKTERSARTAGAEWAQKQLDEIAQLRGD